MKRHILQSSMVILGNTLVAFGVASLLAANHIAAGGVSGIGLVLQYYFNIPLSLCVLLINTILFLSAIFLLGKNFALKTLLSSVWFPTAISFFESSRIFKPGFDSMLLSCILAGCYIGTGIGMVIRANASTGGTDVISLLLNKYFNIPVHTVLRTIDITILSLQMPFSNTMRIIYGIICVSVTSFILNTILSEKIENHRIHTKISIRLSDFI